MLPSHNQKKKNSLTYFEFDGGPVVPYLSLKKLQHHIVTDGTPRLRRYAQIKQHIRHPPQVNLYPFLSLPLASELASYSVCFFFFSLFFFWERKDRTSLLFITGLVCWLAPSPTRGPFFNLLFFIKNFLRGLSLSLLMS